MPKCKPTDMWRTPPSLANKLDWEFDFIADMASSDHNYLFTPYFTEEDDSLNFDWFNEAVVNQGLDPNTIKYVWCNPPYSDPMPWVKKAIEAQLSGLGTVMLLNADTSVGWFLEALPYVSEIRNIVGIRNDKGRHKSGRIAFHDGQGKPINGNNKPQFILVFNPAKIGEAQTSYVPKSFYM